MNGTEKGDYVSEFFDSGILLYAKLSYLEQMEEMSRHGGAESLSCEPHAPVMVDFNSP